MICRIDRILLILVKHHGCMPGVLLHQDLVALEHRDDLDGVAVDLDESGITDGPRAAPDPTARLVEELARQQPDDSEPKPEGEEGGQQEECAQQHTAARIAEHANRMDIDLNDPSIGVSDHDGIRHGIEQSRERELRVFVVVHTDCTMDCTCT